MLSLATNSIRLLWLALRLVVYLIIDALDTISYIISISAAKNIISGLIKVYTGIAAFCAAFAASAAPYLYVSDYSARCGARYIMTLSWLNFIQSGTILLFLLWISKLDFGANNHKQEHEQEIDCKRRSLGSNGGLDDDALFMEISQLEKELDSEERRLKLESAIRLFAIFIALFMFLKTYQSISEQVINPPQVINEDSCKKWIGERPSDIPTPVIIILDKNLHAT